MTTIVSLFHLLKCNLLCVNLYVNSARKITSFSTFNIFKLIFKVQVKQYIVTFISWFWMWNVIIKFVFFKWHSFNPFNNFVLMAVFPCFALVCNPRAAVLVFCYRAFLDCRLQWINSWGFKLTILLLHSDKTIYFLFFIFLSFWLQRNFYSYNF